MTGLTLMAVHAHPDDEASSTGGLLARCAAEGIRTVLVTCTDGRCGDGPGGLKPSDEGFDADQVVAIRQVELETSCAILDVTHLELLGYADSGMMGWPQNDAAGSFWSTPVTAAAGRLAALMQQYRPDVVVTYDENGFYGHPDHIQAHRITMAAAEQTGIPAKLYWITAPRSMMRGFGELVAEFMPELADSAPDALRNNDFGDAAPAAGGASGGGERDGDEGRAPVADGAPRHDATGPRGPAAPEMAEIGVPDEEVTTWLDIAAYAARKFDALSAHASQSDMILFRRMGRDKFAELMSKETYLRIADRTGAPLPESDLFAGLR